MTLRKTPRPHSQYNTQTEFNDNVVSTNKRSQAEVFTVYFSLKYLECNNYNVHFTITSLCPTNVCRCRSPLLLHWPVGT